MKLIKSLVVAVFFTISATTCLSAENHLLPELLSYLSDDDTDYLMKDSDIDKQIKKKIFEIPSYGIAKVNFNAFSDSEGFLVTMPDGISVKITHKKSTFQKDASTIWKGSIDAIYDENDTAIQFDSNDLLIRSINNASFLIQQKKLKEPKEEPLDETASILPSLDKGKTKKKHYMPSLIGSIKIFYKGKNYIIDPIKKDPQLALIIETGHAMRKDEMIKFEKRYQKYLKDNNLN
ncbi:hypothetical protein QP938_12325 [Porticoccaceae bacterium LTM1]|nr:hypothetical protein QP938_12325 [Porticoccaceae bacterium LTM1]